MSVSVCVFGCVVCSFVKVTKEWRLWEKEEEGHTDLILPSGLQLYEGYMSNGGCPWEKEEEGHSDRKSALSE